MNNLIKVNPLTPCALNYLVELQTCIGTEHIEAKQNGHYFMNNIDQKDE